MNNINKNDLVINRDSIENFYNNICLQVGYAEKQNKNFMEEILLHIPNKVRDYLFTEEITIMDAGCGMGFGTSILLDKCMNAKISGFDVCEYAINKANENFPKINFICNYDGEISGEYDVVFSSHCLEHYIEPVDLFFDQIKCAKKYYIVMTPYNEYPRCCGHNATIKIGTFPTDIEVCGKLFKQIDLQIFKGVEPYLYLQNILFVYERIV